MSAQPGKDIIYIDIDDEITAIIDKVRSSHERIVALVLPKRATAFQSIVNMKLLKRTADEARKHLVLITSEAGLLPLAGSVGLYVAKTLQSRPEVPSVPQTAAQANEETEEVVDMAEKSEAKLDTSRPLSSFMPGEAAAAPAGSDEDAPIELDNTAPAAAPAAAKKPKVNSIGKSSPKFRIPDFNKFRTWLVIGGVGLIALIFMWYMGFVVMPRASVTVKTDSTAAEAIFDANLDTEAHSVDADEGIVPASVQQTQKTASQQAEATGQKDKGTKANGEVTASTPCGTDFPNDVPAGTAVSVGDLTYITQEVIEFGAENRGGNNKCQFTGSAEVVAQQNGDRYNSGPRSDYKIPGYTNFTVASDGMSGGTSQIVKVVTQADIDNASQKISSQDTSAVKSELQRALESQKLYVIGETFTAGKPEVTTSAKAGDEVTAVTVTQKTTYSMVGVEQADLKRLVANAVSDKIDPSKQTILDYGLDQEAGFKLQSQQDSKTLISVNTTVIAGSDLNIPEIKKQIAGEKANSAKEIIGQYPGVTEVKVDYSPFWVSSIPKKEGKITVTVEKPVLSNVKKP